MAWARQCGGWIFTVPLRTANASITFVHCCGCSSGQRGSRVCPAVPSDCSYKWSKRWPIRWTTVNRIWTSCAPLSCSWRWVKRTFQRGCFNCALLLSHYRNWFSWRRRSAGANHLAVPIFGNLTCKRLLASRQSRMRLISESLDLRWCPNSRTFQRWVDRMDSRREYHLTSFISGVHSRDHPQIDWLPRFRGFFGSLEFNVCTSCWGAHLEGADRISLQCRSDQFVSGEEGHRPEAGEDRLAAHLPFAEKVRIIFEVHSILRLNYIIVSLQMPRPEGGTAVRRGALPVSLLLLSLLALRRPSLHCGSVSWVPSQTEGGRHGNSCGVAAGPASAIPQVLFPLNS